MPEQRQFLASELVSLICGFVSSDNSDRRVKQNTLWACTLVCRQWYLIALPFLYNNPFVTHQNYTTFLQSICDKQDGTPKAHFRTLIKRLDMGGFAFHRHKDQTAKLLANIPSVEVLVAPPAPLSGFLMALAQCSKLRCLDLSVDPAEGMTSLSFWDLHQVIMRLQDLETLRFPPALSGYRPVRFNPDDHYDPPDDHKLLFDMFGNPVGKMKWPPKLTGMQLWERCVPPLTVYFHHWEWPIQMKSLSILNISPFANDFYTIATHRLRTSLSRLTIRNRVDDDGRCWVNAIVAPMRQLSFLRIRDPRMSYSTLERSEYDPITVETLELDPGILDDLDVAPLYDLLTAITSGFYRKVRRVGLVEYYRGFLPGELEDSLNQTLRSNALDAGYNQLQIEEGQIQTGVYYFRRG
ncbi:hypothetical protein FQN57_001418 [Myotisia sp. PD_48]|nr:hypothetical protein FQN57_001418 [Myotisia sp. PD_48]